ncbi:MAG TPA: hypothetical protein VF910_01035 [Candidatus Bathyarchaeia archaeon]
MFHSMPRKAKALPPPEPELLPATAVVPYTGTILDALTLAGMDGPQWENWRVFWKAVFCLPMTPAELLVYQRHTGRAAPPSEPVGEAWGLVGRRGGKSRNFGVAAGWMAIRRDYTPLLAPGERAVIPVIAADRKQARQVLNYLKGFAALSAIQSFLVRDPLTASVEFKTGVTVEIATASYRTTRGYTVVGLVTDEVAFWRSDDSAEPDSEVLDALRPGMATVPDSLLLGGSTPYARKGELYRAHVEYFGKDVPDVLVWNADTLSMHDSPRLRKFIAKQFDKDATVAASEYGQGGSVVFRADVESFVDPDAVQAVMVANRRELEPQKNTSGVLQRRYFAFTDPSGGSQDAWTLAVGHLEDAKPVLDVVRETQPPFSPDAVTTDYATVLKSYGIADVEGDHYGGIFPRELFKKHGITYRTSEIPKSDIYKEWLPLLNAGRCELLDLPRLKAQLCGLERKVARSGQDSIDHAPGGHDDLANAAAGVLVRAARRRPVISVRVAV